MFLRPTLPDLLAVASLGSATMISQQFQALQGSGTIAAIVVTGIVTYLLGRASNRKLLAEADRVTQETNGLLLKNARDALKFREEETTFYKDQLAAQTKLLKEQAEEHRKIAKDLTDKVTSLESTIDELKGTVNELTVENARLNGMLRGRCVNTRDCEKAVLVDAD